MSELTFREVIKILVYKDGSPVGSITKHPTQDKWRYKGHNGTGTGPWLMSVDAVKQSIGEQGSHD